MDKELLGMTAQFARLRGQGWRRGIDRRGRGLGLAHGRIQTDPMFGQARRGVGHMLDADGDLVGGCALFFQSGGDRGVRWGIWLFYPFTAICCFVS